MFKNLYLFRLLPEWKLNGEQLRQRLQSHALDESQTLSMQQLGWVPPRKGGDLCIVTEGGQCLFALRVQKRLLPATVVKQVAAVRIDELEERQGFRPGKKMRKEITERVHDELLPKAFIVYRDTQVWVDLKNRWLVIDTATASKADEVIGALAKAIDPIHIESLLVQQSSAACMTNWLLFRRARTAAAAVADLRTKEIIIGPFSMNWSVNSYYQTLRACPSFSQGVPPFRRRPRPRKSPCPVETLDRRHRLQQQRRRRRRPGFVALVRAA